MEQCLQKSQAKKTLSQISQSNAVAIREIQQDNLSKSLRYRHTKELHPFGYYIIIIKFIKCNKEFFFILNFFIYLLIVL